MNADFAGGRVALLIDFENLVRAVDEEYIDCEAVFRLADEYGRVLVANAYADWRMKDVNQHQTDLYGLGIELVHVMGHRRGALVKNAVDVKMAVDAVSLMSSLPHIDVYVIVSGDRDFIHVLKELRRHGKTVIGVSPNSAVSRDFSSLCDRFLRYEALTSADAAGEGEDEGLRLARQAKLKSRFRFERDAARRRAELASLFDAMAARDGPFTLGEVHRSMRDADELCALVLGDVVKYARALSWGGALSAQGGQEEELFRDRSMSLDAPTAESLILAYETAAATGVLAAAGETPVDAAAVLGLDSASPDDLAYVGGVLEAARRGAAAIAARRSA